MSIKWGVVGCTGIAYRRTMKGIIESENSTLEIIYGRSLDACKKIGEELGVKYTDNLEQLLMADIDAVYIATPVYCHLEQVRKIAKAKKHILLEKPFGLNSKEAKEIIDICKSEKVMLGAGFMMRYHHQHRKIKDIIRSGEIGDIVSFRSHFSCLYPDIEGAWRQTKALSGGGALVDLGIHCIDLFNYILDDKAEAVCGLCQTQTFNYEVDDSASLILQTKHSGIGHIEVNFNIPDDVSVSKLEIYGTKGSIISLGTLGQDEEGTTTVTVSANAVKYDACQHRQVAKSYVLNDTGSNLYEMEITDFANSILNNKNVDKIAEDALYAQKVCDMAYQSTICKNSV